MAERRIHLSCWAVVLFLVLSGPASSQDTVWTRRFDSGRDDYGSYGGIDPDSNVIVAGPTFDDTSGWQTDITLVKFSPQGDTLWTRTYDGGARYSFGSAAVDARGNVVVVGRISPASAVVNKYNSFGSLLWTRQLYLGWHTRFYAVTTDDSLNIYVSGWYTTQSLIDEVILVKYSPDGDSLWIKTLDFGGDDEGISMLRMTPDGSHLVGTGNTGDGRPWTLDFLTVKLTLGGDTVWTRRLDVKAEDWGTAVACDTAGNIYVTGAAWSLTLPPVVPDSCVTFKYSPDGEMLWLRVYGEPGADWTNGYGITVDPDGNPLVCAQPYDTSLHTGFILLMNYSPSGETNWTRRYQPDMSSGASDVYFVSPEIAYVIGGCYNGNTNDILVMKLRYGSGIEEPEEVGSPGPRAEAVGATVLRRGETLRLSVEVAGDYRVSFCDAAGRRVRLFHSGRLEPGEHAFSVAGVPAGIYFCRIESGPSRVSRKVVLAGR
uniref:T9SS type A sorting domain-containing protein n=1 Tax=candidate division WOR-3 bacterium TaxID=2052148 RepID=A0A7C4GA98_UNCW3